MFKTTHSLHFAPSSKKYFPPLCHSLVNGRITCNKGDEGAERKGRQQIFATKLDSTNSNNGCFLK
ncbi:hypothetical protein WUBG_16866, partial [Wuchereria bancrofti]